MKRKRVLIVDDDPDICVNIKDILDDLGYEADTAHDGPTAIKCVTDCGYAVVILDFQMPGMDGTTLHQKLIGIRPEIAAIMVTAYAQGDGAQRSRDDGVLRVFRKPVDVSELLPLIDRASQANSPA